MTEGGPQLGLALGPFQNRRLFSANFLAHRLPEWPEFAAHHHEALRARLRELWQRERQGLSTANEAQTEERFVKPVLTELGYAFTVQAGLRTASGRLQPDYALFADDEARREAEARTGGERFEQAVAVADAKRFDRPLERRERAAGLTDDPVAQITNYVLITRRPWGILTNGRLWRLYAAQGDLVEGACLELDLVAALEADDPEPFSYFATLLSADAMRPDAAGESLLDRALAESRVNAVRVGDTIERQVFAAVPLLAEGLLAADEREPAALSAAFDGALVLLYRLLFLLYAEARGLLPVSRGDYRHYSLAAQREELATDLEAGRIFSRRSDDLYNDLLALFSMVHQGDTDLGVNEYDGGLFDPAAHPWLERRSVPDRLLAPALDGLYRAGGQQVDYRDLSPRHLGSIYERLLDFALQEVASGALALRASPGRRESGSYYTPSFVVDAIVEGALEPVAQRRSEEIAQVGLTGEEALGRFLELRILDPAMGSGHFLVAAAAYLAQFIATDPSYDGDLPLTDLQRLVAERCLYGVDLNPMAVELARVSLWLSTVRGDEPLTFLANLRVGNSLVGAELDELLGGGEDLFAQRLGQDARGLLARIDAIRARESRAGDDVHAKEALAQEVAGLREPLERLADESLAGALPGTAEPRLFHWALEFPEVFLSMDGGPRDDGGFDAVVGNPPYVRIQALGRDLAAWCTRRYATASGSFDVYVPFVERSLSLLAPGGRLGFIVPNKWLRLDYGRGLRELLAASGLAREIVDFGDAQLFPGATNYTCILLADRRGGRALAYRRVRGDADEARRALTGPARLPAATYPVGELGGDPWVLATGEEGRLLREMARGAQRLEDVTGQIFTGLQTSADAVYVIEDRGRRGDRRVVYSRASERELELEPDLLHPLASGVDTDRYAFRPLRSLLLFPYRREPEGMRLLTVEELEGLPLTAAYLGEHEAALRGRERSRMDHDGWYAFGRTQSLGAHDQPKLGVAATVRRLEIAADSAGAVYFHNVRVNGILPRDGPPSLWTLLVLLNARLLDFIFRRGAGEHAGGHYAANKQFIAPLPIRIPEDTCPFDNLGPRLHESAVAIGNERQGFLDWLGGVVGARVATLPGSTKLADYDALTLEELAAALQSTRTRLRIDPTARTFREHLASEWEASLDRLIPLRSALARDEAAADDLVFDLYGLTAAQRAMVDAEYAA